MINVIKTDIEGVVIIEPKVFGDSRGYFFESWSQKDFDELVRPMVWTMSLPPWCNAGLHFSILHSGANWCVVWGRCNVTIDIHQGSFVCHVAVELAEDNHRQFFVPWHLLQHSAGGVTIPSRTIPATLADEPRI